MIKKLPLKSCIFCLFGEVGGSSMSASSFLGNFSISDLVRASSLFHEPNLVLLKLRLPKHSPFGETNCSFTSLTEASF